MPVVRISDATFADLSTLKTWFGTKSPSETIDRVVREMMDQLGIERENGEFGEATYKEEKKEDALPKKGKMVFKSAPPLSFTKPLKAEVNGINIEKPTWASILISTIKEMMNKSGYKGEELVKELAIPAKGYKYEREGYKYVTELGISVQGQSAEDAWREIDRIASKWHIPVTVEFMWRLNHKAKYPGKVGLLRSGI